MAMYMHTCRYKYILVYIYMYVYAYIYIVFFILFLTHHKYIDIYICIEKILTIHKHMHITTITYGTGV